VSGDIARYRCAISGLHLYLGLIVTFPLLGYATSHAYRDIVGQ
jgi:uncharacterized membrane protein